MTASVPSDPTSRRVRSYPAESFRVGLPVRITVPSASTAVSAMTLSRIEPYRTVVVPEAPVAAIPPRVASAPGSTEKNSPSRESRSLSGMRRTPACTTTSRSSGRTSRIASISDRSIVMPPSTGSTCPSRDDPTPNGITGTPAAEHMLRTACTSSVDRAMTTASGSTGWWEDSSVPWRCSSLSTTVTRPGTAARRRSRKPSGKRRRVVSLMSDSCIDL